MHPNSERALAQLMQGNERFRRGQGRSRAYTSDEFAAFGRGQAPIAALITCVDSRIAPEIIFDQPLGSLLVARVPGNVASESARWMLDIAVGELAVPLVMVIGHTGCRAIQQVLEDKPSIGHFGLQMGIRAALLRVRAGTTTDLFRDVVAENVRESVRELTHDLPMLRAARDAAPVIVPAVYEVETGRVMVL